MRTPRLYPALLGIWIVVVQWRQAGPVTGRTVDLLTSAGSVLLFTLVGAAIAWAMTRERERQALITLLCVLFVTLFSTFATYLPPGLSLRIGEVVLVWGALFALLTVGARHVPASSRTTQILTLAAGVLLAVQMIGLVGGDRRAPRQAATREPTARSAERPDVYVIVLDKYSASRWLRSAYEFDNAAFEDSLRQLGFYLPRQARSNYPHTSLVLATLLNGRLVHEAVADPNAKWPAVFALIEDAALFSELRARGYRFAFFPTTFNATRENRNADIVLSPPRAARTTGAFHTIRANGPFQALLGLRCGLRGCARPQNAPAAQFPYPLEPAAAMEWKLQQLGMLADSAGPIVAFLHLLAPHEPYQFRADCAPYEPWWPLNDAAADPAARTAYRDQVACVNRMLLATVRTLLERSTVAPVILIQADHGHARIAVDAMRGRNIPLADLSNEQVRERLDLFAAYLAPGADTIWYDSVSPANVIPRLLNARYGAALPYSSDAAWWVDDFFRPLELQPVPRARLTLSTDGRPSP